jgi:hypothetical protein
LKRRYGLWSRRLDRPLAVLDIAPLCMVVWRKFMASASTPKPSRVKVRKRLRSQGLRPIQIWVSDVRSPSFRSKAHRQSLAVAASPHAREDQGFVDAASASDDE